MAEFIFNKIKVKLSFDEDELKELIQDYSIHPNDIEENEAEFKLDIKSQAIKIDVEKII